LILPNIAILRDEAFQRTVCMHRALIFFHEQSRRCSVNEQEVP